MTDQSSAPARPVEARMADDWDHDEIDLRQYINVLGAWWREIVLMAVIGAALAGGGVLAMRLLGDKTYEAASDIVIARVVSEVTFDERFRTTSDGDMSAANANTTPRRAALAALVQSGAIAEAVIAELGDQLPEELRIPANLLEAVQGEIATGTDNRTQADLIRITASASDPALAAAIANTWAKQYVNQVNAVYGQVPEEVVAAVQTELDNGRSAYQSAQAALEAFTVSSQVGRLNRLIAEKQGIISKLQEGKQTAIATLVDEELNARQTLIAAYIQALSQNRLLTFNKEQEAKRTLLTRYIDAEVENRLLAFDTERQVRLNLFNQMVQTQLDAANTVFTQAVADRRNRLTLAYAERLRVGQLLDSARSLQTQLVAGGDAAAASTGLALLLLNTQVAFGADQLTGLPANLQLNLDSLAALANDAAGQRASVDALVETLSTRLGELDRTIAEEADALFGGEGYAFLDQLNADTLLAGARLAAAGADDGAEDATVGSTLAARFADLYAPGAFIALSADLAETSAIFAEAAALYPDLFAIDGLAGLSESVGRDNSLFLAGTEQAQELLQLQGLEELPGYTTAATELTTAIDKLEQEIQALTAEREAEQARQLQLTQARDLAWSTFNTLSNKVAELALARTASNSEVRFGAPAVEPVDPVRGPSLVMSTALGGLVGLLAGVMLAFLANYMGKAPVLRRSALAV